MRTLIALHCGSDKFIVAVKAAEISRFLTEHSVKVRPFLFPSATVESNLFYFECVEVFVAMSVGCQRQTESLWLSK